MQEAPQIDLDAERGPGELLGVTLALFARHALLFSSVTLLVVLPCAVLVTGLWAGGFADGGDADAAAAPALATVALTLLMPVLVTALQVMIVRDLGEGRVPSVGQALRAAAPRFPHAIAAVVVYIVLVVGGTLLLVVPGIWVFVAGYFAAQAAVLERRGPWDAFRRSSALVEDRWWWTAGTLLLGWVVLAIASLPVELALDAVDSGPLFIALYTVVQAVTLSLSALFGTLLYFSLCAGKERPFVPAPPVTYLPPLPPTPAAQRPADR